MRSLCDKIEDYMRSPLQIDAEKTLLKKLSIGDVRNEPFYVEKELLSVVFGFNKFYRCSFGKRFDI